MADTIKVISLLVMISVVLYIAQVSNGAGGLFGDDVLTKWVQKDSTTGQFSGEYANTVNESNIYSPNPSTINSGTSSLLNFWDITQIVWDFIKLIANLVFVIPQSLFFLPESQMPYVIKLGLILPMIIISIAVFIFGIFGRR